MARDKSVSIHVSAAAVELLRKEDYPCSEEIVASAKSFGDEGVRLTGERDDMEQLAGFVAGDANHADRRQRRRLELLEELSEALESALTRF